MLKIEGGQLTLGAIVLLHDGIEASIVVGEQGSPVPVLNRVTRGCGIVLDADRVTQMTVSRGVVQVWTMSAGVWSSVLVHQGDTLHIQAFQPSASTPRRRPK